MKQHLPACLVVNGQGETARLDSEKAASQDATTGRHDLLALKGRHDGFLENLRLALDRAKKNGSTVRKDDVVMKLQWGTRKLELEVIPVSGDGSREHHYVILLREPVREFRSTLGNNRRLQESRATDLFVLRENMRLCSETEQLRSQLESLAQEHEAYVEELQSGNDELSVVNEELQCANEEMEVAKEELQSTNE
jgi:two-component system CheB/CheR fusion protein